MPRKPLDLTTYVRLLADCLDLRDWDLTTTTGGLDDDTLATCAPVYGQRRATVTLADGWEKHNPEELRSTITHELIHCHLANLGHLIESIASDCLTPEAGKILDAAFSLELEQATDAIACAIAKTLPLWEHKR